MCVEELGLTWDDHPQTLLEVFQKLLESNSLVDCTIAAEGQYLKAHKVILSACSPYFELLFTQESEKNPIIILKDISFRDLKALIDFIYNGKVQIPEDRLVDFINAAESLQIKGLGGGNERTILESLRKVSPGFHRTENDDSPLRRCRRNCFPDVIEQTVGGAIPESIVASESQRSENGPSCSASAIPAASDTLSSAPCHALRVQEECSERKSSCGTVRLMDLASEVGSESTSPEVKFLVEPKTGVYVEEMSELESYDDEDEDSILEGTNMEEDTNCDVGDTDISNGKMEQDHFIGEDVQQAVSGEIFEEANATVASGRHRLPESATTTTVHLATRTVADVPETTSHLAAPVRVAAAVHTTSPEDAASSSRTTVNELPRRHGCVVCGKTFSWLSCLAMHMNTHTGDRPFKCGQCAKAFSQKSILRTHMLIHAAHRPYSCKHCGKGFSRKSILDEHQRIHTGDGRFKCDHCGKAFMQMGSLKKHLRIHAGECPFSCDQCGKTFLREIFLQTHQLVHTVDPAEIPAAMASLEN